MQPFLLPVLRNVDKAFSDFLLADAGAKKCKIVINGNLIRRYGRAKAHARSIIDPSDVEVQGQVVAAGKVVAGTAAPQLLVRPNDDRRTTAPARRQATRPG